MVSFGAGALTKAGGNFENLAVRRSALLGQKNMGLFAANTVRTSFFAVESGSSFSVSITKKFEAMCTVSFTHLCSYYTTVILSFRPTTQ